MRESGYYPMGAEFDPSAPWNEREQAPITVECEVVTTIVKHVDVETKSYYRESPEPWNGMYGYNYDTSDVDWDEEYNEQYLSIPELLDNMRRLLQKVDATALTRAERRTYDRVMKESQGWEEESTDVSKAR